MVIVMNDEMLRLSLIDFMNNNLLNEFVNIVFDYHLRENEYIYMQYKIINNNIVINIYDNNDNNRFKVFVFTNNYLENSNDEFYYIDINKSYKEYRDNISNKLYLIGALLNEQNNEEKKNLINYIENNDIRNILLKHFIV